MLEARTWRELLGSIIQDTQERQRIANELGVSQVTLIRWVNEGTRPRSQNLQHLLRILPAEYRSTMLELLALEFLEFSSQGNSIVPEDGSHEIPSAFYTGVLHAYSTTLRQQRFWSISNLILQQAIAQLDSNQLGMQITVAQCMPPGPNQKVRSLHERIVRGTKPWSQNIEHGTLFLGLESLAGYAVTSYRLPVIQNRDDPQAFFPGSWGKHEVSAAASPIVFDGRLAGCFVVSSTQPHYFLPYRQALIQNYAELMVLAFEPQEFYDRHDIDLGIMPNPSIQEPYFSNLRQRISNTMLDAMKKHQPITILQAEQLVWQQLEEELLELSLGEGR